MNENTCTLPSDARGTEGAAHRTSNESVVISVAEVMLGTAAAPSTVRPRGVVRDWWARLSDARAERGRCARRRPDYFEDAAMAREMYGL